MMGGCCASLHCNFRLSFFGVLFSWSKYTVRLKTWQPTCEKIEI